VVVVGVQPVTDTIKSVHAGVVGETVDREGLWTVTSPVVLPPDVVAELDDWPDADDFTQLVGWLRERFEVRFLEAPALGRRVEDESAVALLEALAAGSGEVEPA
jgi:2-C-methyl-D-erythritol 4-phosphate cytidylyltransferase